jgi:hypothetical protein
LGTETKGDILDIHCGLRAIITYAATVWWPRVKLKRSQTVLRKLQRIACFEITGAMRTGLTAAIEVLLGLPSLHLQVEAKAKAGNEKGLIL